MFIFIVTMLVIFLLFLLCNYSSYGPYYYDAVSLKYLLFVTIYFNLIYLLLLINTLLLLRPLVFPSTFNNVLSSLIVPKT